MIKIEIGHVKSGGYEHSCFECRSYMYTQESNGVLLTVYLDEGYSCSKTSYYVRDIYYLEFDDEVLINALDCKNFASNKMKGILSSVETLNKKKQN